MTPQEIIKEIQKLSYFGTERNYRRYFNQPAVIFNSNK